MSYMMILKTKKNHQKIPIGRKCYGLNAPKSQWTEKITSIQFLKIVNEIFKEKLDTSDIVESGSV